MKKLLILSFLLTGCTNIDVKAINDRSLRAEAMAAEALAISTQALGRSNDAVEAVSRMAERCCRK